MSRFPATRESETTISIPETLNLSIKITDGRCADANTFVEGTKGDLTELGVQFRARCRDSPDFLRKLRTRSLQGLAYDSRRRVVANAADVGNG